MRRVSVVGNTGSGKSTVAAALARRLNAPYVELDAILHQPGWTELPVDEFRRRVGEVIAADAWVVDGNYNAVRELVWERADTVVWLDLPRWRVMSRLVPRSIARVVTRRPLWPAGNRESWRNLVSRHPTKSIIRWGWTQHAKYVARYSAAMTDPRWAHLDFVRLRTPDAVRAFLTGIDEPL
jgi:adenylate kinase family enzyme